VYLSHGDTPWLKYTQDDYLSDVGKIVVQQLLTTLEQQSSSNFVHRHDIFMENISPWKIYFHGKYILLKLLDPCKEYFNV